MCVAPMMGWTDRHYRHLFRAISRHARLYTEMVTTGALIHGDTARFLAYDECEHPLALQLGGNVPKDLAYCAKLAEDHGYDEVNLNVGCPSDRVQSGRFGACLMAEPALVADCVAAMKAVVKIPVTVKHRIGIDELDSEAYFLSFMETLYQAGCEVFIVHARKAWLQGLSPKQNREIPPLNFERVALAKKMLPNAIIVVNGGIQNLDDCAAQLQTFDGVMVGRAAYNDPYDFIECDARLYGDETEILSRHALILSQRAYVDNALAQGVPLKSITKHWLNVFNGVPGAKGWRRTISRYAHKQEAGWGVVELALASLQSVSDEILA